METHRRGWVLEWIVWPGIMMIVIGIIVVVGMVHMGRDRWQRTGRMIMPAYAERERLNTRKEEAVDQYTIENNFQYHSPKDDQPARYEQIRDEAKRLAETILHLTRPSGEQSLALTKLEEAVMWANAGIARNE